jgi:hypothetical protein
MLLVHLGLIVGSGPSFVQDRGCDPDGHEPSSRFALGFDLPIVGFGFSSQLGVLASGMGIEAIWKLSSMFDAVTRADLVYFPGYERDRVIHQALLAGMRFDPGGGHDRSSRNGWFATVMSGYTHSAGFTPTTAGSGPVLDIALGWGRQGSEGGGFFRLHGRFGLSPDNMEYRAVFLSGGFELRFDPKSWRNRI